MGTTHAWESFGDGVAPDIQAVAKGLGGGYAHIGAVLISKKVATGIRDNSGYWKHGHTYQCQPLACATALAVQKVIHSENLLEAVRNHSTHIEKLLHTSLKVPGSLIAPHVFDIRGGGNLWGVEFDFSEAINLDFKGKAFAGRVQARALDNGLAVMSFSGGSNLGGTKGDHFVFAPAYNVTREEIEKIVAIFVQTVEEVLRECLV